MGRGRKPFAASSVPTATPCCKAPRQAGECRRSVWPCVGVLGRGGERGVSFAQVAAAFSKTLVLLDIKPPNGSLSPAAT